ncbi:MAG: hypothetical protein MRJ96_12085 [Nitrospirales bacterium]|nr:hypothetical protein [Nitrospira sp.]MDR4502180.1 hypothetical protein [Nitrospirales bacterium]
MGTFRLWSVISVLMLNTSACLSPFALDHAVTAYDHAVTNTLTEQLLLNIARAHHHHPIHFTGVSNIAATFDFRLHAGATPPLGGLDGGFHLSPVFGTSVAENPTISIVPIEGKAFTKRLLTPLHEGNLTLLLRQGVDIDLLLRLMAAELRIPGNPREIVYYNRPADRQSYMVFRQVVLQLSTLQDRNLLYVEPMIYHNTWTIPSANVSGDDFRELERHYRITADESHQRYILEKRVTGRILITNYDPDNLPNDERIRLHQKADRWPPNDILVDVRPDHPGGEYPIQGKFRLRSFHAILNFLGRGIHDAPEYDVPKDPRTPPVNKNPTTTLQILESDRVLDDMERYVYYQGEYYGFRDDEQNNWNREAFRLLYQLFQMTVSEVPRLGVPSITIAK